MDKKIYYITVNTGSIAEDQGGEDYHFEVAASEEQIDRLQELFEDTSGVEVTTAIRGMPVAPHAGACNERYDNYLSEVYRMIHELGTQETRAHIEKMNVLNASITRA